MTVYRADQEAERLQRREMIVVAVGAGRGGVVLNRDGAGAEAGPLGAAHVRR